MFSLRCWKKSDLNGNIKLVTIRKSLRHNLVIRKSAFIKSYLQQWFLLMVSFTHTHTHNPFIQSKSCKLRQRGRHRWAIKHDRKGNFYNKFKYFWESVRAEERKIKRYLIADLIQCKSAGQPALKKKKFSCSLRQQVPQLQTLQASYSSLNCCIPLKKIVWTSLEKGNS